MSTKTCKKPKGKKVKKVALKNRCIISKNTFKEVLDLIREQRDIDCKVGKALELVIDSWVLFGINNKNHVAVLILLREIFNDRESDWIGWWLYEDVDKEITYNNSKKKTRLDTAEQLYDFLIKNME